MNALSPLSPKLKAVATAAIDLNDRRFQVTCEAETQELKESIERLGLLNPPYVRQMDLGWQVISGFRRIDACMALGADAVQAWCLPPETPDKLCAQLAIAGNAFERSLSLTEQVRCSRLFVDHHSDEVDARAAAREVGLPPNEKLLHQLSQLADAPEPLWQAMKTGAVQLPMALELCKRPLDEAAALADLFLTLRPNLNRQRELVGYLDDISRRDDLSVDQVLDDAKHTADSHNPDIERPRRLARLRDTLRQCRYPRLVEAERGRARLLAELRLGDQLQLVPPPNFEGRRFQLRFSFASHADLDSRIDACRRLLDDPHLEDLLS